MGKYPGVEMVNAAAVLLFLAALCTLCSGHVAWQDIETSEQQMDALTSRVVGLTEKLDTLIEDTELSEYSIKRMEKRLDKFLYMTGSCQVGFFPCDVGPVGSVQCIRDYLVCDGSADCKNGADEGKERCVNPFKNGPKLPIVSVKDECVGTIPGKLHWWANYPAETLPWFPSRPRVPWQYQVPAGVIDADLSAAMYMLADGVYDYATGGIICNWAPQSHKLVGRVWLDPVSKHKSRFLCEFYRPHATREDTCYTCMAVLENG